MINQQKVGEEMNRATAMMREGNIDGAGEIYYALYDNSAWIAIGNGCGRCSLKGCFMV